MIPVKGDPEDLLRQAEEFADTLGLDRSEVIRASLLVAQLFTQTHPGVEVSIEFQQNIAGDSA